MGFLKAIKQGLEAARNPPTPEQIEAMRAQMSPEQRARYDANMARVAEAQAEAQASHAEAVRINDAARVLEGPAGDRLHGPAVRDTDPTAVPDVGALLRQQMGGFKDAVKQSLNLDQVPQIKDPEQRAAAAAAEREERSRARAPYRAPNAEPIEITRLATRGETQMQELTAFLGSSGLAAGPERVYGVYRVPDRISPMLTTHSEKGRVVEWDVVHSPDAPGSACTPPDVTSFAADDRWVGRRIGEPSVLDEEVGIAFLRGAGIAPEQSFGLARYCEFRELRGGTNDESDRLLTLVKGLVAVHPSGDGDAYERMRMAAPIELAPHPGDVIEVLDWHTVAQVVHSRRFHPHAVPSPFPHLPSTPQELLRSYLEVVGVRPADCWSVQATVDRATELRDEGLMTTNFGPKQPCADGKARMRAHGCEVIVVAYRDRPEYEQGRERWSRYQAEVLQARLARGAPRPPVGSDDITDGVPRVLHGLVKAADFVDKVTDVGWGGEDLVPHRYCWPPIE